MGDEGRVAKDGRGRSRKWGLETALVLPVRSHGGCVSRGGTRLSYALKMFPVAAEQGSAIRARVRGQGSKNLGTWIGAGWRGSGMWVSSANREGSNQNLEPESSPEVWWFRGCASTAGGMGSIPGQRIKILYAAQCSQKRRKQIETWMWGKEKNGPGRSKCERSLSLSQGMLWDSKCPRCRV